jgi:hypothetical protein
MVSIRSPRLTDVAPELVAELQRLLSQEGECALVAQVADLALVELCWCRDNFCSSFYTAPPAVSPYGPGRRTIPLPSDTGILTVDVIGSTIVHVEVLRRDDLRSKIIAAFV